MKIVACRLLPIACVLLLVIGFSVKGITQTIIPYTENGTVPEIARFLTAPDEVMAKDQVVIESVLDLVEVWTVDSTIAKEKQHLTGIYGIVGRMLARYWQKLDSKKRKYIGSCSRPYKVYDGFAKEVDMNIFLMPHLDPYIDMVLEAYDAAFAVGRNEGGYRIDNPEYPSPERLKYKDQGYFSIECEGTPALGYREELAEVFIPTSEGSYELGEKPNFGVENPSFGLYGPWVMDCNHNCRPELHPMEWMWWLDLSQDHPGGENAKSWMVGLMVDDSHRFDDWTLSPITGEITLPVVFPSNAERVTVSIEHLVVDTLFEAGLLEKIVVPAASLKGQEMETQFRLGGTDGTLCSLSFSGELPGGGFRCWWGDLMTDQEKGLTFGELKIAVSAAKLYTGRITVDFE